MCRGKSVIGRATLPPATKFWPSVSSPDSVSVLNLACSSQVHRFLHAIAAPRITYSSLYPQELRPSDGGHPCTLS